jgi:CBS domain-containing protein
MLIRDVMTADGTALGAEDRASTALELLTHASAHCLPVTGDDGRLIGLLSEIHLLRAAFRGIDLRATSVAALMEDRPPHVEPETDLFTAAAVMDEWQLCRLPVCDRGRLVGSVSWSDLLRSRETSAAQSVPVSVPAAIPCGSGHRCSCVSTTPTWIERGVS